MPDHPSTPEALPETPTRAAAADSASEWAHRYLVRAVWRQVLDEVKADLRQPVNDNPFFLLSPAEILAIGDQSRARASLPPKARERDDFDSFLKRERHTGDAYVGDAHQEDGATE